MKQREFIHKYIEASTEKFNEKLFYHTEDDIIDAIENIILSIERDGLITIKVLKFTVVDDYRTIMDLLSKHEAKRLAKPSSKTKGLQENKYELIDLKSSDIKLLLVDYYIAAKGESSTFKVMIAIPRVVDKFYFRLNGCYYSSMYQVVDASTYNSSTSKSSTKHSITLKAMFQAIRIYRNIHDIKLIDGTPISCISYDNDTFKKSIPIMQFIFAKFGFYNALSFMGVYGSIILTDDSNPSEHPFGEDEYVFKNKKNGSIYIHVPKMLYDKTPTLQHIVYVLVTTALTPESYETLTTSHYWVSALGNIFNTNMEIYEKGMNILNSLELIYDIQTKEEIHLPEEYKHDIYCILRWMLWEYNNLRIKDNLNILTKKLKWGGYIALIYAAKLSRSIYRLSDKAKEADLSTIRKSLITDPMYLIQQMTKDPLINFRGLTTDLDSVLPIKFTYKGESGIKTVSNAYKLIHPTNLGILDPDNSSPSEPGSSGAIVPMVKLYKGNYFSEFTEPLTFEKDYAELYNNFKNVKGMKEIIKLDDYLLGNKQDKAEEIIEAQKSIDSIYNIIKTVGIDPEYAGLPLEGSGHLQYE